MLDIIKIILTDNSAQWTKNIEITKEQLEKLQFIDSKYTNLINELNRKLKEAEINLDRLRSVQNSSNEIAEEESRLESIKINSAQIHFKKMLEIRLILTREQIVKIGLIKKFTEKSNEIFSV